MAIDQIRVGAVGLELRARFSEHDAPINIQAVTLLQLHLRKPDGTAIARNLVVTDGPAGLASYLTVAGDLDQCGIWSAQGEMELAGGSWPTSIVDFRVWENL